MSIQLFKLRSYSGGPHFDRPSALCFDLEEVVFEVTIPGSDFAMKEPPRMLKLPYNTPGWFGSHSKRYDINDSVNLHAEIWNYFPVRMKRALNLLIAGTNARMGVLSMSTDLVRVAAGRQLESVNARSLAEYIRWEYEDHYDSPVEGKNGKGWNREVRNRNASTYLRDHRANDPFWQQQYGAALKSELIPTPKTFEYRQLGGAEWACFTLGNTWAVSTQHFCLVLSPIYYLEISIEHRFEVTDRNRTILEPDMQRTADWILQHIKVTRPNGADPRSLTNSS